MASLNKVLLIGNVGHDPVTRDMPSGGMVANVSLATNRVVKSQESGEKTTYTEWHKVVFFGKLADIVAQYVKTGTSLYVEGEIRSSKYTDKEGVERTKIEIYANNMQMLSGNDRELPQEKAPYAPPPAAATFKRGGQSLDEYPVDDDIPF